MKQIFQQFDWAFCGLLAIILLIIFTAEYFQAYLKKQDNKAATVKLRARRAKIQWKKKDRR